MKRKDKRKAVYLAECPTCDAPVRPKKPELRGDFQNPMLVGTCPRCLGSISTFRYLDVSKTNLPNDYTFYLSPLHKKTQEPTPPSVDDLLSQLQSVQHVEVLDHGSCYVAVRDHGEQEGRSYGDGGLVDFAVRFLRSDLTGWWTFSLRQEVKASPN